MTILIDLRKLREPLAAWLGKSLAAFVSGNPIVPICTVGLFGDGFHGSASLHLDTSNHSAAFVEDGLQKGYSYGEDDQGRFCNSCWDFAHCVGEFPRFPDYPDLYEKEIDAPVDYITLDGRRERAEADEGGEGMNRIVFPFLRVILASFEPFSQLSRAYPFRAGVQMHDSRFVEFCGSFFDGTNFRDFQLGNFPGDEAGSGATTPADFCLSRQPWVSDPQREDDRVRRLLIGPVWGPSGDLLTWVEDPEDGGEPQTRIWIIGSEAERAEANRFFEAARRAGKLLDEDDDNEVE